jgi:hypothetical protein
MSAVLFAFEVLAILVVITWSRKNDGIAQGECGTGLLRLREANPQVSAHRKAPRWQRRALGRSAPGTKTFNPNSAFRTPPPRWKERPSPDRR